MAVDRSSAARAAGRRSFGHGRQRATDRGRCANSCTSSSRAPVSDHVTIPVSFLLVGSSGIGEISLPRIEPPALRVGRRVVALSVEPALQFELPPIEPGTVMTVTDFLTHWGGAPAPPQAVVQLAAAQPWTIATRFYALRDVGPSASRAQHRRASRHGTFRGHDLAGRRASPSVRLCPATSSPPCARRTSKSRRSRSFKTALIE